MRQRPALQVARYRPNNMKQKSKLQYPEPTDSFRGLLGLNKTKSNNAGQDISPEITESSQISDKPRSKKKN